MATDAENLASARDAYHRLMTGRSVRVFVDQNGERVEYTVASAARLSAYISELERRTGEAKETGPMRPFL